MKDYGENKILFSEILSSVAVHRFQEQAKPAGTVGRPTQQLHSERQHDDYVGVGDGDDGDDDEEEGEDEQEQGN